MGLRPDRQGGKTAKYVLVAVVAAAALAAGVLVQLERTRLEPPADVNAVLALTRAEFQDLQGRRTTIGQWRGKVVVVNFWATWCPPCRQEIPGLIQIDRKFAANGVQVVGIAVDQAEKASTYATEIGVSYPVLVAGIEVMDIARQLGNKAGVLPFTVVLDRRGNLVKAHLGILTEADLAAILGPLLG
jgi:thiol-disulfide isomerase/thioredoxin